MKKIHIFFMFIVACSQLSGYSIIFVHLGRKIPDYLFDAVCQARLFNEYADIMVIAEQEAIDQSNDLLFNKHKITLVPCESLVRTDAHKKFNQETALSKISREGFWYKTTERFFYLDECIRQYELSEVFHMEYDNMLYVDLEELLPIFGSYPGIAATFDSDERCIPGFIYIAHVGAIEKLINFIAEKATEGLNDMQVIALFKQQSAKEIDSLPIIMPEYIKQYGLCNELGHSTKSPKDYAQYIDLFDSIFDGAAIGQYLGGIDPLNGPSSAGFVNETCLFNASKLTYSWHKDTQGRKVPFASCGEKIYRINNLHVHSKNLKEFSS